MRTPTYETIRDAGDIEWLQDQLDIADDAIDSIEIQLETWRSFQPTAPTTPSQPNEWFTRTVKALAHWKHARQHLERRLDELD